METQFQYIVEVATQFNKYSESEELFKAINEITSNSRQILLNHERYEQEIQQGLHKQAVVEAFYAQKGVPVPTGTPFSDKKGATYKVPAKAKKVEEDKGEYGMGRLF